MSKYVEELRKQNQTLTKSNENLKAENSKLADTVEILRREKRELELEIRRLQSKQCDRINMCRQFESSFAGAFSAFAGLTKL